MVFMGLMVALNLRLVGGVYGIKVQDTTSGLRELLLWVAACFIFHENHAHKNWRLRFATCSSSSGITNKTQLTLLTHHYQHPKPINKQLFVGDQLTCIHKPSLATMMNYTSFLTFLLLVTSASAQHPVLRGTESSVRLLKKDKQNKKEKTKEDESSTAAESSIPICEKNQCRAPDNTCQIKYSCLVNHCEVEELNPCSSGQTCTWNDCGTCKAICSD